MTYEKKLEIAKKINIALREWHLNPKHYALIKKLYYAYVFQCLCLGKDQFTISFDGKYIRPFSERVVEWLRYSNDCLYLFFLKHFTTEAYRYRITHFPNSLLDIRAYYLIYYGVQKPIFSRVTNGPDEVSMEYYLNKFFSLEIKKEYLGSVNTKYDIGPIETTEEVLSQEKSQS